MRTTTTLPIRDHNQESCMPAKEGLAYISLPRGSKLARSSASPSTNSLLIPWLHCPSCVNHDKNVIMPLRGEMAGWKKAKPEASQAGIFPYVGCRSCQRWDTCPIDLYLYASWQESPT